MRKLYSKIEVREAARMALYGEEELGFNVVDEYADDFLNECCNLEGISKNPWLKGMLTKDVIKKAAERFFQNKQIYNYFLDELYIQRD